MRRTRSRGWTIEICNRICRSNTLKPARRTRITSLSCRISRTTSTLLVNIRINSQREFQNHSKSNSAIIWLRRTTTRRIRRRGRTTHPEMDCRTSPRTRSRKFTLRASILSKLTKRTVHTQRRTGRLTHSFELAWTKTMVFQFMTELVTWVTARVILATFLTERALSRTQTPSYHRINAGKNRSYSSRSHPSRAWGRAFRKTRHLQLKSRHRIKSRNNSHHRLQRRTWTCRLRSSSKCLSSRQTILNQQQIVQKLTMLTRHRLRAIISHKTRSPRARTTKADRRISRSTSRKYCKSRKFSRR